MSTQPLDPNSQNQNKSSKGVWLNVILIILAIFVILGLVTVWLIFKYKLSNQDGSQTMTAEDVRKVFTPPQNSGDSSQTNGNITPTPVAATPTPTPTPPKPTTTPIPSLTPTPTPKPIVSPTPTPTPADTQYSNANLGFAMDLPFDWQATDAGDGQTVAFASRDGQSATVQSYLVTNETLDTIHQQLSGSSSVSNVLQTTFLGEPALSFKVPGQAKNGIVLIHNNRIYYIIAPSLIEPPFSSFSFM